MGLSSSKKGEKKIKNLSVQKLNLISALQKSGNSSVLCDIFALFSPCAAIQWLDLINCNRGKYVFNEK